MKTNVSQLLSVDVSRFLGRGERIRKMTRPHLMGLMRPLLIRVVHLVGLVIVTRLITASPVEQFLSLGMLQEFEIDVWLRPIPGWITTLCVLAGVIVLVFASLDAVRWSATRFVLTDQRVVQLHGFFVQIVVDVPLDRLTDVTFRQSILGRFLDYGDLLLRTNASEVGTPMLALIGPLAFRQAMESWRQARVFGEQAGARTRSTAQGAESDKSGTPFTAVKQRASSGA